MPFLLFIQFKILIIHINSVHIVFIVVFVLDSLFCTPGLPKTNYVAEDDLEWRCPLECCDYSYMLLYLHHVVIGMGPGV